MTAHTRILPCDRQDDYYLEKGQELYFTSASINLIKSSVKFALYGLKSFQIPVG